MRTALITHNDGLSHETPVGHPESVNRLESIFDRLEMPDFKMLKRVNAPIGKIEDIIRAHPIEHVKNLKKLIPKEGIVGIDGDTYMSSGSFKAALRGVGAVTKAIDLVMEKKVNNAFCAMRPPGHHAERTNAMGFCLFGNIGIGAKYLLQKYKLNRVAVVDFDVHHGNGTQDLLWDEPNALFISMHQMPLFPGTGASSETGGSNNILNIPLTAGTDGINAINIIKAVVIPRLKSFSPDFILLSSGFDAHKNDPLANLNWTTEDFKQITRLLLGAAQALTGNRLVSSLEGGYNLGALKDSVAAHVKALMEV